MLIRVGVEGGRRPILAKCRELQAPILVSANSLWDKRYNRFSSKWKSYLHFDVALDSGGFVAMKRYGGYRWTVHQYVELAKHMQPTWFAQMDYCCEPELASDRHAVWKRIDMTVTSLNECMAVARQFNVPAPLPVLQGWEPKDYCQGPIYDPGFEWPEIVGVGSVCRRHVQGPNGILAVMDALDRKVPEGVRFHLFGAKSTAVAEINKRWPHRLGSIDSMAWNFAARRETHKQGLPRSGERDAGYLERWYRRQVETATITDEQLLLLLSTNER